MYLWDDLGIDVAFCHSNLLFMGYNERASELSYPQVSHRLLRLPRSATYMRCCLVFPVVHIFSLLKWIFTQRLNLSTQIEERSNSNSN